MSSYGCRTLLTASEKLFAFLYPAETDGRKVSNLFGYFDKKFTDQVLASPFWTRFFTVTSIFCYPVRGRFPSVEDLAEREGNPSDGLDFFQYRIGSFLFLCNVLAIFNSSTS